MADFLVSCLKDNKEVDRKWQNLVLEYKLLIEANDDAEAILAQGLWTQYNKLQIACLCEDNGLF